MISIRGLFFILVILNASLLLVFLTLSGPTSPDSIEKGHQSKATSFLYVQNPDDWNKAQQNVVPTTSQEPKKTVKPVSLKDVSTKKPVETPKEKVSASGTKKTEEKGKMALTKSEADELNEKINNDPKLKEMVVTFKKLKSYYQTLNDKYDKLNKEHEQLKKTKAALEKSKKAEAKLPTPTPTPERTLKTKTQEKVEKVVEKVAEKVAEKPAVKTVKKIVKKAKESAPVTPTTTPTPAPAKKPVLLKKKYEEMQNRTKQVQSVLRVSNPFNLLGAYPEVTLDYFNSYPDGRPFYNKFNYGLKHDDDYCEITDLYNLAHPENMFRTRNFFTDYAKNGLARTMVIRKIGHDLSWKVSRYMPKSVFKSRTFHLDPRINNFFTKRVDLHIYHEIGKHFLCATQMYNHIPGHGVLKRKDLIVDSVDTYAEKYQDKSHCFNKHKFFPFSYRLYIESECKAFFNEINSKTYAKKAKADPIQYLIKVGYGAHRAQGVFLLDNEQTADIKAQYENGKKCGMETKSLVAQTYITNPLLLNFNNKFDFRIYMLVASTNPLIAFYHDGFLRVSLQKYDKFSNDRSTHLTNTHLSKDTFAEVSDQNITLHGMNEEELRNYQMWTLERLEAYLLESGKIKDPNWLNNYLRPKFREAFVHILKMTAHAFWKGSNVYEMFGLDFMLDSELNLWFIECNSSPQLIGTNEYKTNFLIKMLRDLFEIQYAYYKSRMARLLTVLKAFQNDSKSGTPNYEKWKVEYAEAAKNRLEPEYKLSAKNGFVKIIDLNLKGPEAYFGNLKEECVLDD